MKKILFIAAMVLMTSTVWADSMRGTAPTRSQACDGTTKKISRRFPNARIHGCHCRRTRRGRFDCRVNYSRARKWIHDAMHGSAPTRFQACDGTTRKIRRRFPNAKIRGCQCKRSQHGRFHCTVNFRRRP